MEKRIPALLCIFLLFFIVIAGAEQSHAAPGSGDGGFSLSAGYDGSYLDYKEYLDDSVLDKDTGWQNGIDVEARAETRQIWTRALAEYSGSDRATYEGSDALTGTPIHMRTRERFWRNEAALGYKILNLRTSTITPYVGIGYREWKRGRNALPDYLEKYTWYYVPVGVNYVNRIDRWTFGADGAVQFPFSMKMTTDIAGTVDKATFHLKSRPGFRAELPVTYDVVTPNTSRRVSVFVFGVPYYQYWEIGRSDVVTLTSGGAPVDFAFEPKSKTDVFGFKAGLGIHF